MGTRRARLARRAATIALVTLASALAADQAVQWTVLRDGEILDRRVAPFDPPLFCAAQRASLERIRAQVEEMAPPSGGFVFDAELGWAPRLDLDEGGQRFDWAGCRVGFAPLAREKDPAVERLVTLGCSFTFGAEVVGIEAWPALLDQAFSDLEVGNLAMGGYGLDQALLRWRRDGRALGADEVWLGFQPSAILRNVTVYAPAMRHWADSVAFKPRFVVDAADGLQLVANPLRSLAEVLRALRSQEAFLDAAGTNDFWVRANPIAYASAGSHWMHRFAVTRLWLTHAERRGRKSEGWLLDPHSEPYRVARALVLAAAAEVEAEGARFRFLVLPDRGSLAAVARDGRGSWQILVDDLRGRGLRVLDLAPALLAAGAHQDDAAWAPEGHYSALGNRLVADALAEERIGERRARDIGGAR